MSYLDQGGNLYIEGVDLGQDLLGSEFFDFLGLCYDNTGGDYEVDKLTGTGDMMSDMSFNYLGGPDPHYSVDNLCENYSVTMFECENGIGRMFVSDKINYKVITSSVVLGAMADGKGLSIKPFLISEIVNYFLDLTIITSHNDNLTQEDGTIKTYPNPFEEHITIDFNVTKPGNVVLEIYNQDGRPVTILADKFLAPGQYSETWDGSDFNGNQLPSGIYYYKLHTESQFGTGRMVRIK